MDLSMFIFVYKRFGTIAVLIFGVIVYHFILNTQFNVQWTKANIGVSEKTNNNNMFYNNSADIVEYITTSRPLIRYMFILKLKI